jgi:hypothetical protein
MLQGLKTSVAVLLGLIIGVAAALPLAWHGTRKGADSLVQSVGNAVAHVEHRQQAMADQALRLQPLLRAHGAPVEPDLFDAVQDERSRLAGDASLTGKLRQVQALEEALLRIEKRWQQAGSDDARLRSSFAYGEFGRVWEKQKRLLVREQMRVEDSVEEVNRILTRWPASTLLRYKTFGGLLRGIFGDVLGNVSFLMRLSLDWAQWERPKAKVEAAYLDPLRPPVFLAYAPLPEDQVDELQFTQEPGLDYSDVQLDADPAVLENRHAPKPYTMPQPTVQKTVDYRGAR